MKSISILFLILFTSAISVCQDINEGLLLDYSFNETTLDQSVNNYDGDPFGITYTADRFGNPNSAASFDGVNDYVNFPNLEELKPELPVSFSFWIKYTSDSNQDRAVFNTSFEEDVNSGVFFTSSQATNQYGLGFGNGSPFYNSSSIENYISNGTVETNEWTHISIVVSSPSDMQIYVDCVELGGSYGGSGGSLVYSDLPGCIGRHDQNTNLPAFYFEGAIDDFKYWSRAITAEEVGILCNADESDCPSLAANFNDTCDDGNDQTDNDLVTENCECVGTPVDDGTCSDYSAFYVNHGDGISGSELYALSFTETEANLSFLTSVDFEAHIAYNALSQIVYIVDATGVVIKRYDVSSGAYLPDLELNPAQGVMDRLLAAVYNPADSLLYVGDENDKKIYTINLSSGEALFYANADVKGGDLAFQNQKLYLATRSNHKLYEIVEGEDPIELGSIDTNVNGMASGSEGNALITAHFNTDSFLKINSADGSHISAYPALLDGLPYILLNGDMASGCGDGLDTEEPDSGTCYADVVVEYVEGLQANNSPLPLNRANPDHALGEPEGSDSFVFTTLGYGGSITFSFDGVVPNGPGDDIEVVETSFGNPGCDAYPEFADVLVSQNGVDYFLAKTVCKSDKFVDISDAGEFENVSFIKIVNNDALTTSPDGFDLDGIVALHNCDDGLQAVMSQNELTSYPNPAVGVSNLVFTPVVSGRAIIEVYDLNGKLRAALLNSNVDKGLKYQYEFNTEALPEGLYLYRLSIGGESVTTKFMVGK